MLVLKMVNRHLAKLSRKYIAIRKGDPRAVAMAEELSQVTTVRDEIQKILVKLGRSSLTPRSLPSESPTVETLLRQMDELAHQFAETPREDPLKSEIANEITRLSFLADALSKSRNSQ
jgi:L-2-hydroxyglutarate oxidase LhgO